MKLWRAAPVIVALAAVAGIVAGCGGDSNGDTTPNPDGTDAPAAFETARADLQADLEGYGENIGSLPNDIREDLLASCRELASYASDDAVDDICSAVERAIDNADPGLIDLVLNELDALTPE